MAAVAEVPMYYDFFAYENTDDHVESIIHSHDESALLRYAVVARAVRTKELRVNKEAMAAVIKEWRRKFGTNLMFMKREIS